MEPSRGIARNHDNNRSPLSTALSSDMLQVSSSPATVRRLTSDESWIEVSSQPSSSSLSSATNDEVVTTGLRITHSMNNRRRRRLHQDASGLSSEYSQTASTTDTSQNGYDESESDADRAMSSSNEAGMEFGNNVGNSSRRDLGFVPSSSSDDDEKSTALGRRDTGALFTPQPNAFTRPSSMIPTDSPNQDSYFTHSGGSNRMSGAASSTPPTSQSSGQRSLPRSHARARSHTPYTMIAPNHSVPIDHDAALRASLSTLLSCAAAARGLPKRDGTQRSIDPSFAPSLPARPAAPNRIDQGTLRLVSESSLNGEPAAAEPDLLRRPLERSNSSGSATLVKRKSKSPSHERRKKRVSITQPSAGEVKPANATLMTWVAGVGVMVLFSAISFSAGYALGKDVGKFESSGGGTFAYGPNEVDGLKGRTWRWGNAGGVRA